MRGVGLSNEVLLKLYGDMLRIRRVEEAIGSQYHLDEMKTPIHLCSGQEAISVGVCAHLRVVDPIFTTYRSHGQYLAKGGDLNALIAELHGRETGCSKGRGGSMHVIDLAAGHFGSSAIVAGAIPVATGMALANQMKGSDVVTTVFFGDGATDQGVFYESVNFAMLKRLPIVYVYENNEWAVCSHISARKAGECLFHEADSSHLRTGLVNGNDVIEVYGAAAAAAEYVRAGNGPAFIECKTYRVPGHAGAGTDEHLGYRSAEEIASWKDRCPIAALEEKLHECGTLTDEGLGALEKTIVDEIAGAFSFAKDSALPKPESVLAHVYRE